MLYNAVDVERFAPAPEPPADGPVLLAGGDQTQGAYRVELALQTFAHVLAEHPDARLIVTGSLLADPHELVGKLGLGDRVAFVGRYSQAEAPSLYRRAHLLLHTQMNDSCPSVVLEAMASGLPVVHPASGGTVELVGDAGGTGVEHEAGWDRLVPPPPRRWQMPWGGFSVSCPRTRQLRASGRSSGSPSRPGSTGMRSSSGS